MTIDKKPFYGTASRSWGIRAHKIYALLIKNQQDHDFLARKGGRWDNWMPRDDIQWAYELTIECDPTFDAPGLPRHLEIFLTLLTHYPDMRFVIGHCIKLQIPDPHAHRRQVCPLDYRYDPSG